MSSDNYRFAESDSLLCYHGPMLYEAKCLKRRKTSDGKAQYFIHYKGWNSKWEEWVDDDRVLAVNAVNMNKMASLKALHSNSKKSGGKRSITTVKEENIQNTPPIKGRKRKHSEISSESIPSIQNETKMKTEIDVSTSTESKPKKRGRPPKISVLTPKVEPEIKPEIKHEIKREVVVENKPEFELKAESSIESKIEPKDEIKKICQFNSNDNNGHDFEFIHFKHRKPDPMFVTLNIPLVFKQRVIHDQIMINECNKVLKFPAKITIEKLLRDYIESRSNSKPDAAERAVCVCLSLMQYFNVIVETQLLYKKERANNLHVKATNYLRKKEEAGDFETPLYLDLLYPKVFWSTIYSPTYLLRLLLKMPVVLSTLSYNENYMKFVLKSYKHFFRFLEKRFKKYFSNDDYESISSSS